MATIRYFINRINTYDFSTSIKQAEIDTIKHILRNNSYEVSLLDKMIRKEMMRKPSQQQMPEHPKQKWAKFTYVGSETRIVTKLFRHTQVKVAYTTKNNLEKLLRSNSTNGTNKYTRSGIYQLNCPTCSKKYIGQTSRSFQVHFREHKHDYKYMCYKSKFAQHLLEEGHSFDTMENIMKIIHYARKGRMMDALEKFHIYNITHKGVQINDRLTIHRNPIFDAVLLTVNIPRTGDTYVTYNPSYKPVTQGQIPLLPRLISPRYVPPATRCSEAVRSHRFTRYSSTHIAHTRAIGILLSSPRLYCKSIYIYTTSCHNNYRTSRYNLRHCTNLIAWFIGCQSH